jgi:DnaJ-class molecular chaperone
MLLCCTAFVAAGRDFYKILGIAKNANQAEIKRAYRQKSLQYHPDKNPGNSEAEKMFQDVAASYEVLSNEDKRRVYDQHGEEGLKDAGGHGDMHDPFASMFGGFGFGFGGRGDEERRTPDVRMPLSVSLEDLYNGRVFEMSYYRQVMCMGWNDCQTNCPDCSGPGMRTRTQRLGPGFVQHIQTQDDRCVSKGKCWSERCTSCPNGPTEESHISLTVDLVKGMADQEEIVFHEVADEKLDHLPGNLVLVIKAQKHAYFTRDGDNLRFTMSITLHEALVGFEKTIKQLDGRDVVVKKDSVTACEDVFVVPGEGMPRKGGRGAGNLIISFKIEFPRVLSSNQKSFISQALA